jgi:hypothetical protein
LVFVVAALVVAAALTTVPLLMDVPSAGDVCNADTNEEQDELEGEKTSAALIALCGALLSSVAAMVAIVSAVQRRPAGRGLLMVTLGLISAVRFAVGVSVAFVTALVVC